MLSESHTLQDDVCVTRDVRILGLLAAGCRHSADNSSSFIDQLPITVVGKCGPPAHAAPPNSEIGGFLTVHEGLLRPGGRKRATTEAQRHRGKGVSFLIVAARVQTCAQVL